MTGLQRWLDDLGLGQYADLLAENNIDREVLPNLDDGDLAKLGIPFEHRKKLIEAAARRGVTPPQTVLGGAAQPPQGAASLRAERRHLTVLFCDVVGSTALSARLDPEDLRAILYQFQSCCGEAIQRYDGHIFRLMGDGVLAYFGYPTAHEDDAERAVNAALQILQSISAVTVPGGQHIDVRIGIATGLVVVGDLIGEGRELGLVGEAPNLASRLQQLASPNQILVAPRTRRLLGRLFDLEEMGEHRIPGIDGRVAVWRVVGPSSLASRFEARRDAHFTPLVGRKSELKLLRRRYREAKRGKGRVVLVSGEPGVGKSRLIMALREQLAGEECRPVNIQCSSYHTSSAWYPIIRYLEDAAGITRETPPALKLDKLEAVVGRHAGKQVQSIVPLLAALLSIPVEGHYAPLELTPQQQKNRTFGAVLDLLEAQAEVQPIVLVVEDVHWIDPTSLELLGRIRDRAQRLPILAILLFRPGFSLGWGDQPHVTSMTIVRLDPAHVAAMVELVAGNQVLSPEIRDEIAAKTDGVPLFIEEMTKAVIESGRSSETRVATGLDSTLTVPDTLHESLMARLDQVASMKRVAQAAAVIGREFSFDLLEAIAPLSEVDLRVAIERLLESGLLFRSGHAGNDSYLFKHALVQDEAYASLLREERRGLHVRIAEVLCNKFIGTAEAAPEIVAHHYTRAGQRELAVEYWLKAGRRASERSAFAEAITHLETALKLLNELPATPNRDKIEVPVQQSLGSALIAVKGFGSVEASQAFERALELCNMFDDSPQTYAVLTGMVGVHLQRADFVRARELAQDLLDRADRQDDSTPKLMGHSALGMCLVLTGELPAGRDCLHRSLELYDVTRHGPLAFVFARDFKAMVQAHLALTDAALGNLDEGLAHGRAAVEHAERLRHPHSLCYALPFSAGAHVMCGDAEGAYPLAERTMVLAAEYGFPLWLAGGRLMRGWALLDLGDSHQGLSDIRQSLYELAAIGTVLWVQFGRYVLAQAMAKAGDGRGALGIIDEALSGITGDSGRWYAADLHRLKGDVLLEAGERAEAEACYEAAIALAARQEARLWQLRAMNSLASLWRAQGRMADLHARLGPLYASFDEATASPHLRQARALLAQTESALASRD
ncbi:MAG: AAA family ATPase [Xanthobacteraceae bacterium]